MILGFGTTETEMEQYEGERVLAFLKEQGPRDFFRDEDVAAVDAFLKQRSQELRSIADENKVSANPPGRYSTFWASVLANASNLVVIFNFMHINRRHPFSPDGWASLSNRYVHVIELDELKETPNGN